MSDPITIGLGDLKAEIWPLGARLNGVWFQGSGNLVDGSASVDEALGPKKFNGATVGQVANRIAGATATLGERVCTFEANENGKTTLHSGSDGLHARTWSIHAQNDRLVVLELELKDGDGGFPGNRRFEAQFEVIGTALRVHYSAETDRPTWVNLALHPYWTLGEQGRAGQSLKVNADHYTPVDLDKIPTGEISDVTGTSFDLRELGVPSFDIDHNFCLNEDSPPAVTLHGDQGIHMTMTTDAPGLQVFTGKEIGIAIEPQHWPDAMHHDAFPSIVLQPHDRYSQTSFYQFSRA